MFSLLPQTALAEDSISGSCGSNVTWILTESGKLTISGSGRMDNYAYYYSFPPWYDNRKMIKSVTIGKGVNHIGNLSFGDCENLTSVTIPSIGRESFRNCGSLTSITIPASVDEIDSYAFYNCKKLSKVTLPKGVTEIGYAAFEDCISLKNITLPSGLLAIGGEAFENCKNLTGIVIPSSVTDIGREAFRGCTSLVSLEIQNGVSKIDTYAFWGCSNLTSVTLPGSITSFGSSVFEDCTNLKDVVVSEGITNLYYNMFDGCSSLNSITIPASITSINCDFSDCSRLKDIYYTGGKLSWGKIYRGKLPASATVHYNTYAVILDTNGGKTVTPNALYVTNGKTYGTLPMPSRSGYTFKGWYTAPNGGTKVTASTKFNPTTGQTLYAQWTKSSATTTQCKITLDANGGKVTPASISVAKNSTYLDKLPTPTRSGYTFKGWYTTKNGSTKITASTKATVSRTIYAQWTKDVAKQYTVFFDPIDGEVDTEELVVTNGTTYGNLPTPTRAGYTFNGWYTEETGGTRIVNTTTVNLTGDQILYAQWTKGSTAANCTIKLNANGGKVTPASISVAKNSTYLDKLPTPTRSGYTFKGWYTTKNGSTKITASTKATVNRKIYAQWTKMPERHIPLLLTPPGGGCISAKSW